MYGSCVFRSSDVVASNQKAPNNSAKYLSDEKLNEWREIKLYRIYSNKISYVISILFLFYIYSFYQINTGAIHKCLILIFFINNWYSLTFTLTLLLTSTLYSKSQFELISLLISSWRQGFIKPKIYCKRLT